MVAPPLRLLVLLACSTVAVPAQKPWWTDAAAGAVARAGDNGSEIRKALQSAPVEHREAMDFLVANMPGRDLRRLKADFLLQNVALAKQAMAEVAWGKKVPKEIFLNDVLPYANVSETREAWRPDFYKRFLPLVKKCKTPGEAAQLLNSKVFGILKVRYSTRRRRADQSPSESAEIGVASCTGLSIILADACRAVGVPARLAGIPNWVDKRGNHTWVEVWDDGWHFTGAAEPSTKGLNHAWFVADAAKARADVPEHSIYAVSYKKTGTTFPMRWSRRADPVSAVNVTARYAKKVAVSKKAQLRIRVREAGGGQRVIAEVEVALASDPKKVWRGVSRGERNDANDILSFDVDPMKTYVIRVTAGARTKKVEHRSDGSKQQLVDITLPAPGKSAGK